MKIYDRRELSEKQQLSMIPKKLEHNEYICETAGFEPLEVKLKRFEQAGIRAQFSTSEFTSSDYRDMYLNPDFQIYPGDDLEDIMEKQAALNAHIAAVKEKAAARAAAKSGVNAAPAAAAAGEMQSKSVDTEESPDSEE